MEGVESNGAFKKIVASGYIYIYIYKREKEKLAFEFPNGFFSPSSSICHSVATSEFSGFWKI